MRVGEAAEGRYGGSITVHDESTRDGSGGALNIVDTLSHDLVELNEAISTLHKTLDPVLREEDTGKAMLASAGRNTYSSLASRLHGLSEELRASTHRLRELNGRVDL